MSVASFPVRAEDAVFLHAQTAGCPQQVGAVVLLSGPGVDLDVRRSAVAARVARLPELRRRLVPARGRSLSIGIIADPALIPGATHLATAIRTTLTPPIPDQPDSPRPG